MLNKKNIIEELGVLGDIINFRNLLPYDKSFNYLSKKGNELLLYNSNYYSLQKRIDKKCLIEIKLLEFIASALSNISCKIFIEKEEIINGFILEGTNLYFSPNSKNITLKFIPESTTNQKQLNINNETFLLNTKFNSFIVEEKINSINSIYILPNIEGVTFYFKEIYDDDKHIEVYSLINNDYAKNLKPLISNCYDFLRCTSSSIPLSFIQHQLRYISVTEIHEHESSSDPRNAKGVVTINFREDLLVSTHEKTAWILHGLVHEAKHLQFFDLFIGQETPSVNWIKSSTIQLTNDWGIRVPCAWRGKPSLRSMADHLLALQAFIPGIIILLEYLKSHQINKLSIWLHDHIELELRVINGAMGSLILGREHLTENGYKLFSILQHDYHLILIPLLEQLKLKSKY